MDTSPALLFCLRSDWWAFGIVERAPVVAFRVHNHGMSLGFGTRTLGVRIDTENATIASGFGVYPLTLQLALTSHGFENGTVVELAAELQTQGNPGYWLAGSTRPVRTILYGNTVTCSITFPLTSGQILGIEERRSGQRPGFSLKLYGSLPAEPTETGQDSSEHFSIAASSWLDLIERISAAVAFTIPIPIPITPGAHAEGAELLREARHHLNAGNIDAAIVSARGAMERAEAAAHWPNLGDDNPRSRSVEQRWRAIYQAAMSQASGAAHEDDVTKDFVYNRREAEALIGIAAALLKAAPGPLG